MIEKLFNCDQCPKTFSLAGDLKKHKIIQSGDKPFTFNGFSKLFFHACDLNCVTEQASLQLESITSLVSHDEVSHLPPNCTTATIQKRLWALIT